VSTAAAAEAPAHRFAAPATGGAATTPAAGLAQVTVSLVLVLAVVFVAAWLVRRLRGFGGHSASSAISIVAERAVGPRERVVLLQVGADQVLVGVAGGSVQRLHVLAAPSTPVATSSPTERA
jgi:flagellar protein FliO/FliZ